MLVRSVNISHPVSQALLSCPPMLKRVLWATAGTGKTLLKHQWLHQPRPKSPFGYPCAGEVPSLPTV